MIVSLNYNRMWRTFVIFHINDHNPSIAPIMRIIATRHEKFELCVLCLDHAIYAGGIHERRPNDSWSPFARSDNQYKVDNNCRWSSHIIVIQTVIYNAITRICTMTPYFSVFTGILRSHLCYCSPRYEIKRLFRCVFESWDVSDKHRQHSAIIRVYQCIVCLLPS